MAKLVEVCPNLLPFIREKWAGVPQPTIDFAGKTALVTGSNVGLGFEAAVKFTALNAEKVILAVRNTSKGAVAQRQIEQRTHRQGVVDVWELDMDNYASIQNLATRVERELSCLDIAVLNAGVSPKDYVLGSEGWEAILQVNVMGTALLGLLLLPKLKASRRSEINALSHLVVVTSEAHRWLEEKDFPDPGPYGGSILKAVNAKPADGETWDGMLQNARPKLFAMYVTQGLAELANTLAGESQVIVNSVCPGACKSELVRNFKSAGLRYSVALKIFDVLFNKTTEEGARVYVSTAALGSEAHGCWYKTTAITRPGDLVTSSKGQEMQQQVWKEIVDALKTRVPEVEALAS